MNISKIYQAFKKSSGVCTDSRKIQKGQIFFSLSGENFNGNVFALSALEQGASLAIIDDETIELKDPRLVKVDDCLETLQELANFHRKQFDIPVVAITGSNGKTTTKELLDAVLTQKYKVHATKGNYNNHIGVPKTGRRT